MNSSFQLIASLLHECIVRKFFPCFADIRQGMRSMLQYPGGNPGIDQFVGIVDQAEKGLQLGFDRRKCGIWG